MLKLQGRIFYESAKSQVRKITLDDNGKPSVPMKKLKVCIIPLATGFVVLSLTMPQELHGGLGVM
jgi:hypothetical protein